MHSHSRRQVIPRRRCLWLLSFSLFFWTFFQRFGHPAKVSDVASRFSSLLQQSKAHVEFELPEGQLPEGQFLVDHLPHTCTICILYTYSIIYIYISEEHRTFAVLAQIFLVEPLLPNYKHFESFDEIMQGNLQTFGGDRRSVCTICRLL